MWWEKLILRNSSRLISVANGDHFDKEKLSHSISACNSRCFKSVAIGDRFKYWLQNSENVRIFLILSSEKPRKPGSSLLSCSLIILIAPVPHVPLRELADTYNPTPKYNDNYVPLIICTALLWLLNIASFIVLTACE